MRISRQYTPQTPDLLQVQREIETVNPQDSTAVQRIAMMITAQKPEIQSALYAQLRHKTSSAQ